MSVTLSHRGLPEGVSKFDLLKCFEAVAKPVYGISTTARQLLRFLIPRTQAEDYAANRICAFWGQVETIAAEMCLSARSINNAVRELEHSGFIVRTTGTNGARGGKRVNGKIQWAAGLNLQPLVDRYAELVAEHNARQLHTECLTRLRQDVRNLGHQLCSLDGDAAQIILPDNRTARITEKSKLESLKATLKAALETLEYRPRAQNTSDAPEANDAPSIQTQKTAKLSSEAAASDNAFRCSPQTMWAIASDTYRSMLTNAVAPTWRDVIETSRRMLLMQGGGERLWGALCQQRGREGAALCVAIVEHNSSLPESDRYHVRNANACLNAMTKTEVNYKGLVGAMLGKVASQMTAATRADRP